MQRSPYELVFGQPPRQNLFPGIEGTEVMEEDVEDILDEEEKGVHTDLIEAKETRVTEEDERGGSERGGSCIHDRRSGSRGEGRSDIGDEGKRDGESEGERWCQKEVEEKMGSDSEEELGGSSQLEEDNLQHDCGALGTSQKHLMTRIEADKRYRLNADRMRLKYCKTKRKKVMVFAIGNFVSIKIPRIDRTSTDFHRVPCIVVERLGSKFHLYRLR